MNNMMIVMLMEIEAGVIHNSADLNKNQLPSAARTGLFAFFSQDNLFIFSYLCSEFCGLYIIEEFPFQNDNHGN